MLPTTIIELALRIVLIGLESMSPEQRQRGWTIWFAFWDSLHSEQQQKFWDAAGEQLRKLLNPNA